MLEIIERHEQDQVLVVSPRERDTVIAALRLWQKTNRDPYFYDSLLDGLQDIATDGGTHDALDSNEIDILIEDKINGAKDETLPCVSCGDIVKEGEAVQGGSPNLHATCTNDYLSDTPEGELYRMSRGLRGQKVWGSHEVTWFRGSWQEALQRARSAFKIERGKVEVFAGFSNVRLYWQSVAEGEIIETVTLDGLTSIDCGCGLSGKCDYHSGRFGPPSEI